MERNTKKERRDPFHLHGDPFANPTLSNPSINRKKTEDLRVWRSVCQNLRNPYARNATRPVPFLNFFSHLFQTRKTTAFFSDFKRRRKEPPYQYYRRTCRMFTNPLRGQPDANRIPLIRHRGILSSYRRIGLSRFVAWSTPPRKPPTRPE